MGDLQRLNGFVLQENFRPKSKKEKQLKRLTIKSLASVRYRYPEHTKSSGTRILGSIPEFGPNPVRNRLSYPANITAHVNLSTEVLTFSSNEMLYKDAMWIL